MYRKDLLVIATTWILGSGVHALIGEEEEESRRNLLTGGEPVNGEPPLAIFSNFALIEGVYTTNGDTFVCGGALLRSDIVLTSAACLNNAAVDLTSVLVHVNVASLVDDDDHKITRSVDQVLPHPAFDYENEDDWYFHDIAIIHLDETIGGLEDLEYNIDMNLPNPGSEVIIYGFGTTSEDFTASFTEVPHRATLSVVPHDDCNEAEAWYKGLMDEVVHICATDDQEATTPLSQDTCMGDTGAPLLSLVDGKYVVVGITSGGEGCGRREVPAFYSRVSHHASFIKDAICEMSSDKNGCPIDIPWPCFSGLTQVETPDRGFVAMKDLVLGDMVKVSGNNRYEPIYSFGHFDKSIVTTDFLQIETLTSSGLEITPNHFIFIEGNKAVPASSISVGDKVVLASGETDAVTSINTVSRTGIFAPFTPSGTIVTNGIKSSSFATIQDGSRYVSLGGGLSQIPITYHQLGVIFESPHRLFCHFWFDRCKIYETYNEEGLSIWVETPMNLFQWMLHQNIIISGILFFSSFAALCILNLLEIAIKSVPYLLTIGGGSYTMLLCYKRTWAYCTDNSLYGAKKMI